MDVQSSPGTTVYRLGDGTDLTIKPADVRDITSAPTVGDLLLYGEGGDCGSFLGRAVPRDIPEYPNCLGVAQSGIDDGEFILFQSGLRLPKASGFPSRPRYVGRSALACLDDHGQVVFFR